MIRVAICLLSIVMHLNCGKKMQASQTPNPVIREKYVDVPAGLNIRETPDLNGKKIVTLVNGTRVTVLESRPETFKVGAVSGSWARISDGKIQGWVFDGFLSTNKPAGDVDAPKSSAACEAAQSALAKCEADCKKARTDLPMDSPSGDANDCLYCPVHEVTAACK